MRFFFFRKSEQTLSKTWRSVLCCASHCERRLCVHCIAFTKPDSFKPVEIGRWVSPRCAVPAHKHSRTLNTTSSSRWSRTTPRVDRRREPHRRWRLTRRTTPHGDRGSLHHGSGWRLCLRRRSRRGANAGAPQEKACRSSPCRLWQELQVKRWTPPRSPSSSLRR